MASNLLLNAIQCAKSILRISHQGVLSESSLTFLMVSLMYLCLQFWNPKANLDSFAVRDFQAFGLPSGFQFWATAQNCA